MRTILRCGHIHEQGCAVEVCMSGVEMTGLRSQFICKHTIGGANGLLRSRTGAGGDTPCCLVELDPLEWLPIVVGREVLNVSFEFALKVRSRRPCRHLHIQL